MKKALIFLFCAGVVSFAAKAEATQITYDFNSFSGGLQTEAALSAYTPGVTFDNTGGGGFTIAAYYYDLAVINFPYNNIGNSTIATLSSLTDYVSVTMGDYGGDADHLYLYAFDSANSLVDSAYFYLPGYPDASANVPNTLSVSTGSASIAWVEFYGVGVTNTGGYTYNSVYWDDFTFNQVSSVPEPSTMLLLGSGLVGLVGIRKRFKA